MMSSEYDGCGKIIVCTRQWTHPCGKIPDFTGIPFSTVYVIVKRFKETEQEEGAGTPARKKHDRSFQKKISFPGSKRSEDEDPSVSMQSLAARLGVSEWTLRKTVHEDLKCRSYVLKVW